MTRKTIRQYRLDAGLTQQQVADALIYTDTLDGICALCKTEHTLVKK